MWIERLMAGISHQHVLSYNPNFVSYVIKASGRMRTAAYNEDVANDFYNL